MTPRVPWRRYVDNTDVETMRAERWDGIDSKARKNTVAENQALWEEMKKGTPKGQECVVRMRMDMSCLNKCLRDPGLYRVNLTPHGAPWRKSLVCMLEAITTGSSRF
jgi:glutamyl-tRNA synthetase